MVKVLICRCVRCFVLMRYWLKTEGWFADLLQHCTVVLFRMLNTMNEDDGIEFVKATVKEIKLHNDAEHWTMI